MSDSPWKPGGRKAPPSRTSILALVLLIKILGVTGFVGLLVVAQLLHGAEYDLRIAALLWFAIFGIAYVLVGFKSDSGRRWP